MSRELYERIDDMKHAAYCLSHVLSNVDPEQQAHFVKYINAELSGAVSSLRDLGVSFERIRDTEQDRPGGDGEARHGGGSVSVKDVICG